MKKFQSRFGLLQRLFSQRRKLAELDVLRARAAISQVNDKEQSLRQQLRMDANEFENLANGPVPAHLLVACRLVTELHTDQLTALGKEREARQQELHNTLAAWQKRSIEVDQSEQLTQQERHQYEAERLASEQLEIDERSMALHRPRDHRRKEMS